MTEHHENILALNWRKAFRHSDSRLNRPCTNALSHRTDGFDLRQTFIDGGTDILDGGGRFLWADVVIYQNAWLVDGRPVDGEALHRTGLHGRSWQPLCQRRSYPTARRNMAARRIPCWCRARPYT